MDLQRDSIYICLISVFIGPLLTEMLKVTYSQKTKLRWVQWDLLPSNCWIQCLFRKKTHRVSWDFHTPKYTYTGLQPSSVCKGLLPRNCETMNLKHAFTTGLVPLNSGDLHCVINYAAVMLRTVCL